MDSGDDHPNHETWNQIPVLIVFLSVGAIPGVAVKLAVIYYLMKPNTNAYFGRETFPAGQ